MPCRYYYGIAEIPYSNLSPEDSLTVRKFGSRAERDAWVIGDYPHDSDRARGVRRAVTRASAARAVRKIMTSVFGGRQSGYWGLRELPVYWSGARA